jgi:hypothetical protein
MSSFALEVLRNRCMILASERHCMITLLVGVTTVAAIGLGWYGHKAMVRISIWGRNMDEQDAIFQAMEGPEFSESPRSRALIREGVGSLQAVGRHLPIGEPSK